MKFLVVDGDWPVTPYTLTRSELVSHSVEEADGGSEGGQLIIHGHTLVALCQQQLNTSVVRVRAAPDLSTLGLTILHESLSDSTGNIRLVTPKSLTRQVFAVDDLLVHGRLIVFTSRWESLASAAIVGVKSDRREEHELTRRTKSRPEETKNSGRGNHDTSVSRPSVFSGRNRTALHKFTCAETYFQSIPPATVHDLDLLNNLIQAGTIRLDPRVEVYLCTVCGFLPRQTFTTSCCGAIMCGACTPLISTSSVMPSVMSERYVCIACKELPFTSHTAHVSRDAEVMKLVRELRVLHHPQLASAASATSSHGMAEKSHASLPFLLHSMGIMPAKRDVGGAAAPVLGSVFPNP
ncbi:hypothetical protein, conserved [Trypanosoma brucei gambiense DAL972]|uniref:Uncharacterized protein n=1 Tax=Trypanosoma brucei gambiense (strain MHOM/CI/86/DAL972) TaxID=679716 RepID=C9ZIA4_TRYB9|nr:hypothetical protein, conserved [Trypanosoma brucei gambiense DAL972]CBH08896.1 hypothetical protein, conserved [Trypanosoma brucei gambiense DAL972]|eukprot:XP_011771337.1 hypothetical protein, conserved [Trypanosoma brucei gambiense DAL972]